MSYNQNPLRSQKETNTWRNNGHIFSKSDKNQKIHNPRISMNPRPPPQTEES